MIRDVGGGVAPSPCEILAMMLQSLLLVVLAVVESVAQSQDTHWTLLPQRLVFGQQQDHKESNSSSLGSRKSGFFSLVVSSTAQLSTSFFTTLI